MFQYIFSNQNEEPHILTPFVKNLDEIKKEITQTANCIHNVSTYPNGVILDITQYHDKIIVKCNYELIKNVDGTYSINI